MMSAERSFEAWEEVQRHGHDLADRLAQGFTGLIQSHIPPPPFPWPPTPPTTPKLFDFDLDLLPPSSFVKPPDFKLVPHTFNSSLLDIGTRIGRAGTDFGNCLDGFLHQFLRGLPLPVPGIGFKLDEGHPLDEASVIVRDLRNDSGGGGGVGLSLAERDENGCLGERLRDFTFVNRGDDGQGGGHGGGNDEVEGDDPAGFSVRGLGHIGKPQGMVNVTSTYNSRTQKVESSLAARGDSWRVEASRGSSSSGNDGSSLFLLQLGPILFVRDSTLLLPIHLSKQRLLWYGYDRKNGIHSLCPAVWSKHRRWLLMSMLCLNPIACSFIDLQFPNGQFTYVSGEGLTTSAFLPFCGGLLQAEGQYPGEMRFSFSHKVVFLCKSNGYNLCAFESGLYFVYQADGFRILWLAREQSKRLSTLSVRINGEHASHRWCSCQINRLAWASHSPWLGRDLVLCSNQQLNSGLFFKLTFCFHLDISNGTMHEISWGADFLDFCFIQTSTFLSRFILTTGYIYSIQSSAFALHLGGAIRGCMLKSSTRSRSG